MQNFDNGWKFFQIIESYESLDLGSTINLKLSKYKLTYIYLHDREIEERGEIWMDMNMHIHTERPRRRDREWEREREG